MKSYVCVFLAATFFCGYLLVTTEAGTPCRKFPKKVHPEVCCKFPQFKDEKVILEECMKQHGAQALRLMTDKSEGPQRGCCLAECILNGTGHGDLNPDKMVTDALKDAEDQGIAAEWSPIIKDMTKYCFDEGTKRMPEFEAGFKLPPLDPADQVCHPKYAFGMMCSMKKMIANCPASLFNDTPECKELQEFSKTCDL